MNTVIIHGNLGTDPEVRATGSGLTVANLSIATNERKKENGEWVDHTEWHRVAVFGKQAESCAKFLSKGSKVLVQGKLRTRNFTDKNGQERWSTEILADNVEFGGRPAGQQARPSAPPAPAGTDYAPAPAFNEDEIPF